jgi:hypothetical protein
MNFLRLFFTTWKQAQGKKKTGTKKMKKQGVAKDFLLSSIKTNH